ncbi:MAG TPA: copper homeostasis protein CutC [Puia sp.]|nr:copper homeostasis protein CutC [Puia sp.]
MLLEICAFNLPSALIAQAAGADRIEFCTGPQEGGVTPSAGLIRMARQKLSIPLYPIIRPRDGDFLYSDDEYRVMLDDIAICKAAGCDGVVVGMLLADGNVDRERCARLVERAYPMGVTFHRAFDRAIHPLEAMETILAIGCERILTSGQRPVATEGVELLSGLVREADGRIVIMPGSGVRASNIAELAAKTAAVEFHTSARMPQPSAMAFVNGAMREDAFMVMVDEDEIRRIKAELAKLGGG